MADLKNTNDDHQEKINKSKSIDELVEAAQDQAIKTHHAKLAHGAAPKGAGLSAWVLSVSAIIFFVSFILHYEQMFHPFNRPDARQIEHTTRLEIITAADYLDTWRTEEKDLPLELPDAIDSKEFIEYGTEGNKYTLSITVNGKVLRYVEGDDKAAFLKAALTD